VVLLWICGYFTTYVLSRWRSLRHELLCLLHSQAPRRSSGHGRVRSFLESLEPMWWFSWPFCLLFCSGSRFSWLTRRLISWSLSVSSFPASRFCLVMRVLANHIALVMPKSTFFSMTTVQTAFY
jgi:hypothetical protein